MPRRGDQGVRAAVVTLREALDAALREWVKQGEDAQKAWQDALKLGKESSDAAWPAYSASHEDACRAHDEGLNCCLDHDHDKYESMLDFIAERVTQELA